MKKIYRIYGYARISRKSQSIERQIRNILALYPDAIIYQEAFTGTKIQGRKELEKMVSRAIKEAEAGAEVIIVFDSVSRMSRNAQEGIELYHMLYEAGIELEFIKEPHVNTATFRQAAARQIGEISTGNAITDELIQTITSAVNKFIMDVAAQQIAIAFEQAEKEVSDLHQRTKEGLLTAKLNGKQVGQRAGAKLKVKKAITAKELIKRYSESFDGSLNDIDCMKVVKVSRNSFYKYKKELRLEIAGEG